jgi:two-component system sensor histidine kinase BarA
MDLNLSDLPVIDWEQGKKLAGNNSGLANEIIEMLIKRLPQDLESINQLSKIPDYLALRNEVHKLHGAVCYCGTPRLKATLMKLETDLKNHIMIDLPYLLDRLNDEVQQVLDHFYSRRNGVAV